MKKMLIFLLFALISITAIDAQTKKMPFNMGIYGGLNNNMHDLTNTVTTTTVPYVQQKSANGMDFNVGLIGNIPLNDMFYLSIRLGYNGLGGGELISDDLLTIYKPKFSNFEFSPTMMFYNIIPVENLYLLGGLELGIPIGKKYNYHYDDGVNVLDVDMTSDSIDTRIALILGAGYTFELSKNVFLSPEVSFRLPFNNHLSDGTVTWNIPQVRLGVNLTFGLFTGDDYVVPAKQDAADIKVGFRSVSALDRSAVKSNLSKITLEEVQYTEQFPLIPYIFFDENTNIPSAATQNLKSKATAGAFNIEEMSPDALEINHNLLDIVGTRMNNDKNVSIKLVGTLDGKAEAKNTKLAKERADYIRNYLIDNYNIDPSRITAEAGSFPVKPSSQRDAEGVSENRRVEIYASNPNSKLLDPITIQKDRQRIATPEIIEFDPYAESTDAIEGWELDIYQSDRLIRKFSGAGTPDKMQWSILPNELTANNIPVDYNFRAWTVNGVRAEESGSVPVEYFSISKKKAEDRPDRTISKYSLVLFDFDSPDISQQDKDIMVKSIVPEIKTNSTVQIYGYSDRIGEETYNKNLSMKRASNVKDFLTSKVKNAKFEVFGVGEAVEIFNNDLPTGRHLSRTVQVYVITPKN